MICKFPAIFADEALGDAFCQGLFSDTTKQAACLAFSSATKPKQFSLNNEDTAAEVEEAAQQTISSTHEVAVVAATTQEEKDEGQTECKRAVDSVTRKFAPGQNILSERMKLFTQAETKPMVE